MFTNGNSIVQSNPIPFRWSLLVNLGGIYLPFIFVTPSLGAIELEQRLILFLSSPGSAPALFLWGFGVPGHAIIYVAVVLSGLLVVAHAWFGMRNGIYLIYSVISSIAYSTFVKYYWPYAFMP